jgi:hypothetical protein
MKVRQFRFRAVITLDPVEPRPGAPRPRARPYPSHTRALMIAALPLRADGGPARLLPAEIWRDGEEPLSPGDRATVTARVSDDHADAFLDAGRDSPSGPAGRSATAPFTGGSSPTTARPDPGPR